MEETEKRKELDELKGTNSDQLNKILINSQNQSQMFDQLIRNQIEVKDAMIDSLHKELEYYRQDAADRYIEQLMKDVIKIRKSMKRQLTSEIWLSEDVDQLRKEYKYIFEDITDLLEQQNIDAFSTEPGEPFDGAIHQPRIEITDNPALDKTIKESISEGYMKGTKVLQPERVVVYQYQCDYKKEEMKQ